MCHSERLTLEPLTLSPQGSRSMSKRRRKDSKIQRWWLTPKVLSRHNRTDIRMFTPLTKNLLTNDVCFKKKNQFSPMGPKVDPTSRHRNQKTNKKKAPLFLVCLLFGYFAFKLFIFSGLILGGQINKIWGELGQGERMWSKYTIMTFSIKLRITLLFLKSIQLANYTSIMIR